MTVSEVLSSCMNILYGATVVHLYGKHSEQLQCKAGCVDEQWRRKEVDWWRINRNQGVWIDRVRYRDSRFVMQYTPPFGRHFIKGGHKP